jgi:hypothetical protein
MSEAAPQRNTFNTPRYDHELILARLRRCEEIVLARDHSMVAAVELEREGQLVTRWEGRWMIARRVATGRPGPAPADGGGRAA